jgi:superfamily II DNA or RNA helicase
MTENSQKKKPLILESSDESESSVKSEKETGLSSQSSEKSALKSDVPSSSSPIPLSSTPIPSSSSSNQSSSNSLKISDNLEEEYKKLNCLDENYYSKDCNKFLLKKELLERNTLLEKEDENQYLYPNLNDKDFNIKIANKEEFNDTRYDGAIHENIKEHADLLAKADFELQPHQAFVKNFLSFQTPYSSLLLYHGLGSGKTCSAIGVCEEMRDYMKQMGTTKRIIIVASENVQDNFKLQLFDERKLKLVDGLWNIRACTGNKLLKEINPMNMKGMTKDKVVSQIKNLINTYYIFLGYVQFANYIIKTMNYNEEVEKQKYKKDEQKKKGDKSKINMLKDVKIELNSRIIRRLRNEFDNRLIVIDEVHNIRKTDDNENKKVAINLELLVKSALNMRFLLLSATPMYNSYKEMIWLLNLMNTNDRRGRIEVRDIFKKTGDFKDGGEELLTRKSTGYISFVRGENPYTFPYRVYPIEFAKEHTFPAIKYPSYQMNLKKIKHEDKKRVLSLYLTKIGECGNCGKCQYCAYKYIIYNLRNKKFSITTKTGIVRDMPNFENMESFGYTLLQTPLESLIISYPIQGLKSAIDEIPQESLSEDFSQSFSELSSKENEEEEEEEAPGPIEGPTKKQFIVESSSSERKESEEPEEVESESEEKDKPIFNLTQVPTSTNENLQTNKNSQTKGGKGPSIDPHQLTGKIGLERMMNYVDEKSPPVKGDFEYKKSTLDHYGKIFSREHIGKYSSKIKSILDNIVNEETEKVSDGVILIYSQYIDSGLIPMALALEEMGFTRYGQGVKPLFKNKPSEVVDVTTMKAPADKKKFMPARYAMITGETRLSPNNDFEVKGLTGEDNKDGNKVKVVLISKAGSEGIDLKFIRQVHILEPWYNMNRIEQIIGRAVRNFSHKDLPFEKRNVEIFMYGTILGDNKEEAADLYVYRVAEYKAIQIGKVTRVLKETAVDCIINHDQTNFTQENISKNLKEPIKQILSNGTELNNFKIGDAPFSPACDYMAECNYDCRPDKDIDLKDLNKDTYNENFIVVNSEKILQRIRMLMKESYFYKKDVLIRSIRTPKEYPYVQIYSALTQLVEDENEFITDKYGRNGRLVNIGDYYLFQPVELRDKNASIFDRSTPIDYKHEMINFEIKQNIVKPVIDKRNINKFILEEEEVSFPEGNRLINEMKVNFDISREFTKQPKVPRGDDNWYKHCGIVMKKMSKEYPDSKEYIISYLVAHMMELLLFEEKLDVMNYLYSLETINKSTFEWFAKEYFEQNIIKTKNFTAFIMYKLNKRMIMILNKSDKWIEAEPEDQREIASSKETKDFLAMKPEDYNRIIGFIGYEKSNRYLVFKTKDMLSKRDTGARCDESGKVKTLQKINEILGENKYTNENTKAEKDSDGNVIREAVGHVELCVLQEFLLRYFNTIKREDKKWFISPEMAIWHKLYTVFA